MAGMLPQSHRGPLDHGPMGAIEGAVWLDRARRSVELLDHLIKRAIDVLLAALMLVVLSPAMLIIAVAIRLGSPGPAYFQQVRVEHRRSSFVLLKFRTMYQHTDDAIHRAYVATMLNGSAAPTDAERGLFKLTSDPRVTSIGNFLRKASLDELPQLINVLRGEMSLVGPRPVLPWEAELFEPRHQLRFTVKPGITGLWQVSGRSRLTMQQALDLDVDYVRRHSLVLDLTTLIRTVPAVLRSREAC